MTVWTRGDGTEPTPAAVLEQGLRDCFGESLRIVEMDSAALDSFSTHPISCLHLTLADGKRVAVIFKRLQRGPEKDVRREREVLIYQRLLAGRRFGAPMLYASLCDDARGYYWLFLEDVSEWKLEYCGMDDWLAAFRWLARLHSAYYGREAELRALDCLGEHGPAFYQNLAATAWESLRRNGEPRALAHFNHLMEQRFETSVAYLARQPRTLVHGDMSCHNLIVQPGLGIRPIDWEWAAIGPAAWDLAKLLDGWGSKQPRLLAAYLDEFALRATAPFDRCAFERSLAHCEIMKRLWYLRWWIRRCQDPPFVDRLLDKMETIWQRLDEQGRDG